MNIQIKKDNGPILEAALSHILLKLVPESDNWMAAVRPLEPFFIVKANHKLAIISMLIWLFLSHSTTYMSKVEIVLSSMAGKRSG